MTDTRIRPSRARAPLIGRRGTGHGRDLGRSSRGSLLTLSVPARYRRLARLVAASDVLALLTAMFLAFIARFGLAPIPWDFALVMTAAPLVWLGVFSAFGLYRMDQLAPAEEFRRVVSAVAMGITAIAVVSFWSKSSFSRIWVALTWLFATLLVLAARKAWHRSIGEMKRDGRLAYRTLIAGTNREAQRLAAAMDSGELGFRALGCLATGRSSRSLKDLRIPASDGGLPVVDHVSRVQYAIRGSSADCVFVASTAVSSEEVKSITKAARLEDVEVRLSANLPEVLTTRLTLQLFDGTMALSLRPVRLTGLQAAAKRTFDLLVSAVMCLISLPLWVGIALAVKLTSSGPVVFRQSRVGQHGRVFTLLKFRTMVNGAEALVKGLQDANEADGPLFKVRKDPRVTRVGRWLRRWSFDEFPQLINVMRGDMSLVGPRPALPTEVAQYREWHHGRLEVRPGITGLWQVSGRAEVTFDEYVRLDMFYIENWSLSYDLFILAKTIPALFSRRGAY
jgi:exopolysaccharide biosynthesis polyprenyl glycosylphosphotransferase